MEVAGHGAVGGFLRLHRVDEVVDERLLGHAGEEAEEQGVGAGGDRRGRPGQRGLDRQHAQDRRQRGEAGEKEQRHRHLVRGDLPHGQREDDEGRRHQRRCLAVRHRRQADVRRLRGHQEVVDLLGEFIVGVAVGGSAGEGGREGLVVHGRAGFSGVSVRPPAGLAFAGF